MKTIAFDIDKTLLTLTGYPINNVLNMLIRYKKHGYNIILITARFPHFHNLTKRQLQSIGLDKYVDLDEIYYTSGGTKMKHLINNNVLAFFDDLQDNIIDIIKNQHLLPPEFKLYQVLYKDGDYKIYDTKKTFVYN